MIGMTWIRNVDHSKYEGLILAQAQSTRLYILFLVNQDHIESIGKANTIKRGMRCCLMACLLKMLSDMLQKPSTTFSYPHMSQTKSQTRPHRLIYPAPPSSFDIATARNPSQFGLADRDLGLTEMGLQTLCLPS